jgi:hypothetical protein
MRALPHPVNVTPIAAMALFSGAYLGNRLMAYLLPLAAMLVSDVILAMTMYGFGFFRLQPVIYSCFAATVAIGCLLGNRRSILQVIAACLASSILFFIVTNFAVWSAGDLYPQTWTGLVACYTAAIPYFRNSLLGDLAFAALFFGSMALVQRQFPAACEKPSTAKS